MTEAALAEKQEVIVRPKLTDETAVVHDDGEYSMLFDSARFNQAQRVAKLFSESKLVPDHFRGSAASVFVALHMAMRMNLDPMMVMQKTYIIAGKPGMEAQLLIALVNARGPFTGPIQWEFSGEGENRQCTAYAIHAKTGERCEVTITWKMVKAEGWAGKQGSKWMTIPDLMFRYRSATYLARLYCPEVIMGLSTVDELKDMGEVVDVEAQEVPAIALPKETQVEKIKAKIGRPKKAPETAQAATSGEAGATGQVGGEKGAGVAPGPQDITADQLAEINKVPDEILAAAYLEAGIDKAIKPSELDRLSAEKLLGYTRGV